MKTDWDLIRKLMNSAIDACEKVEELELSKDDNIIIEVQGQKVSIWDFLQSSWIYPENLTNDVVRARHQLNFDEPYRSELARTLIKMAELCAETVNAKEAVDLELKQGGAIPDTSIRMILENLSSWYENHMIVSMEQAAELKKAQVSKES